MALLLVALLLLSNALGQLCEPRSHATYLAIGQDLQSISMYSKRYRNPAAIMSYTNLSSLNGLTTPVDYGSGIEFAEGGVESFDNKIGLQLAVDLGGDEGCTKIVNGTMDDQLTLLVQFLRDTSASRVFLRLGYEFDNPQFNYHNPKLFKSAFVRISKAISEDSFLQNYTQNKKVLTVYHSFGQLNAGRFGGDKGRELDAYFPGDEWVDWVGVSLFKAPFPWLNNKNPPTTSPESFYYASVVASFSKNHKKPFMIAESSPWGGVAKKITFHGGSIWDNWYEPVLEFIEAHNVQLWSYISSDWDSFKMWKDVGFGDSRLTTNEEVERFWDVKVVNNNNKFKRRFLQEDSLRNCGQTGFQLFGEYRSTGEVVAFASPLIFLFFVVCFILVRRTLCGKQSGYRKIEIDEGVWYVEKR
ncbi:hypothetical protein ScalyP_jg9817 [Parmales sp. scaly parma]|nr:hypothetical protein ScalyP_jg9817 [Parmales sp. scaly parma]